MLSSLQPLQTRRNLLPDQIYQALCEHIIAGKLVPGERLREAQVGAALGVSRTPVREAFARLERQYLLRKDANGAYFVRRWEQKTLWEVASLRAALEALAIRLACPHLTPNDVNTFEVILSQMELSMQHGDIDRLVALDIDFHSRIWHCSGHALLRQMLEDMKAPILFFMYTTRPGDEMDYASSHRLLLDVMQQSDVEKAAKQVQEHIYATALRAAARLQPKTPSAE